MTLARWSTVVSGLVLVLALGAGRDARAQWGFGGVGGAPWGGQYGAGYGGAFAYGFTPYYGYDSIGMGYGNFVGFPMPGFAEASGQIPQTTTVFPGLSWGISSVPGWDRPGRTTVPRQRVRRRR